MSDTYSSRLRVLVAKTFRAEKLYSSMRNMEIGRLAGASQLSELSNDIRAREWQRNHYHLRTALNDLLSSGSSQNLAKELKSLCEQFEKKIKESAEAVSRETAKLHDSSKSQEFAHCLHIVVDLIRHRARLQACRTIKEELAAILSGGSVDSTNGEPANNLINEVSKTNLIDFQKRAVSGGRNTRS